MVGGTLPLMPELPDITVYVEHLDAKLRGSTLQRIRVLNPFLLRTAVPPITQAEGRRVIGIERLGKRVVLVLDGGLFLVIHLMIAGRLRWLPVGAKPPGRIALATFEFDGGTLVLTEAGTQRRASLHLLASREALNAMDPGGIDVMTAELTAFGERLTSENHTLKRALTDPRLFSGIGNAYSDEILHAAKLSPVALTQKLSRAEIQRLHQAVQKTLTQWICLLRQQTGDGFPENVTAFRPEMAVHGKFGQPCRVCGAKVQRIRYAENETNYCPGCQTRGRLLADRSLSLLLKKDWPKKPEELDEMKKAN